MLAESGLPELEARVLRFLCAHSGALKLAATLDDAQRLLHEVCFLCLLCACEEPVGLCIMPESGGPVIFRAHFSVRMEEPIGFE
jgi:hypothetical protein